MALALFKGKLCEPCREIPTVLKLINYEHPFYSSLKAVYNSADQGCEFCRFIVASTKRATTEGDLAALLSDEKEAPVVVLGNVTEDECAMMVQVGYNPVAVLPLYIRDIHSLQDENDKVAASVKFLEDSNISSMLGHNQEFWRTKLTLNTLPALDPSATEAIARAKHWLDACTHGHSSCSTPKDTMLPRFLVHTGSSSGLTRVVEHDRSATGRYTALSYVWGCNQEIQLTTSTISLLKQGIATETLPATTRDAIWLTRELGIEYIWIDALCIVQDDKAIRDAEILRMHEIYSLSYLTIQAGSAAKVTEGFLNHRSDLPPTVTLVFSSPSTDSDTSSSTSSSSEAYSADRETFNPVEPLKPLTTIDALQHRISTYEGHTTTRAWIFEESVLPPRLLIYGTSQTQFRCKSACFLESRWQSFVGSPSGPSLFTPAPWHKGIPVPPAARVADPRLDLLKVWYHALDYSYTPRALTKEKDRLPAIAGIATVLSQTIGGAYVAGCWTSDWPWCLLWQYSHSVGPTRVPRSEWRMRRDDKTSMRAPSWSWVSVNGAVTHVFPMRFRKGVGEVSARVVRWPEPCGLLDACVGGVLGVEGGVLRVLELLGPKFQEEQWDGKVLRLLSRYGQVEFVPVRAGERFRHASERWILSAKKGHTENGPSVHVCAVARLDGEVQPQGEVFCLFLTTRRGLLLAPRDSGVEERYTRVGSFQVMVPLDQQDLLEESLERKVVEIA